MLYFIKLSMLHVSVLKAGLKVVFAITIFKTRGLSYNNCSVFITKGPNARLAQSSLFNKFLENQNTRIFIGFKIHFLAFIILLISLQCSLMCDISSSSQSRSGSGDEMPDEDCEAGRDGTPDIQIECRKMACPTPKWNV